MKGDPDAVLRAVQVTASAIVPALDLLPHHLDTTTARLWMVAIGYQESKLRDRAQVLKGGGKGAARGLWQHEVGTAKTRGGVWGIYLHPATAELLRLMARARDIAYDPHSMWAANETDDVFAACCARLSLWANAHPLPIPADRPGGWAYYLGTWNPGTPRLDDWPDSYAVALSTIFPKGLP